MKTLLSQLILWLAVSFSVNAQPSVDISNNNDHTSKTYFLNADFEHVNDLDNADFKVHMIEENHLGVHVRMYRIKSNTLLCTGTFASEELTIKDGKFTFYYPNGNVESKGEYKDNIKIGEWKRFELDGSEKPSLHYTHERYELLTDLASN